MFANYVVTYDTDTKLNQVDTVTVYTSVDKLAKCGIRFGNGENGVFVTGQMYMDDLAITMFLNRHTDHIVTIKAVHRLEQGDTPKDITLVPVKL